MKDIGEIRRANLRRIEQELGGASAAAKKIGMFYTQFANLRDGKSGSKTTNSRGMRDETARRIERRAGKPCGWLDIDHAGEPLEASGSSFVNTAFVDSLNDVCKSAENLMEMYDLMQRMGSESPGEMQIAWINLAAKTLGRVKAMSPERMRG